MKQSWISPAPICCWTSTHVTGIVSGGGGFHTVCITATACPIIQHGLLLVLCHPLEAAREGNEILQLEASSLMI